MKIKRKISSGLGVIIAIFLNLFLLNSVNAECIPSSCTITEDKQLIELNKLSKSDDLEIKTDRLILKKLNEEDRQSLRKQFCALDYKEQQYFAPDFFIKGDEDPGEFFDKNFCNNKDLYLSIMNTENSQLMGIVGYDLLDNAEKSSIMDVIGCKPLNNENDGEIANICYWVSKDYRKKGYCTEAVVGLFNFLKKETNTRIFRIMYVSGNEASSKVVSHVSKTLNSDEFSIEKLWGHMKLSGHMKDCLMEAFFFVKMN